MPEATQVSGTSRWRFQSWLRVPASARPRVYQQVVATAEINSLSYWLEIFFSAGIATFGLVENSPAVIIGAMLISPLTGPIMATGLSLAVGDLYLGIKAVFNLVTAVIVSMVFSGLLVWLLPFHSVTTEIASRTNPNLLDLGIALFSGLAGSVVVCRGGGEGVTVLPGVAIAVALMPPLCAMGFGLGSGMNLEIMGGAGLLFLTNLVAIVASAFLVFLLVGMNSPEVRQAMAAVSGNETLARFLSHGPLARSLAAGAHLRWRILMLLVLLASIAVPLRRALLQVAGETLARGAVEEELKRLVPANAIVSQQVTVGKDVIEIRLLSTRQIPDSEITGAREELMRRTGRDVQLTVNTVASRSELADLMERFVRPPPPLPPRPKTVAELRNDLLARVTAAIEGIWPSADAPIQSFDVLLGSTGVTIDIRYLAAHDLGDVPIHMIEQNLQTKLALPGLTVKAERAQPPPVKAQHRAAPSGQKE